MTITTTINKVSAVGDGIQTNFPYNFKVTDADQMLVYLDNVLYGGAYTVNGVGAEGGGSVDIPVPPSLDVVVLLYRFVEDTQETDYEPYRAFPSQTVEDDFDLTVMRDQQVQEQLDRSVKAPISDDGSFDYTLPTLITPGRTVKVNATGDGFIETTYDPDEAQTDSAVSAAAALVSENAAAVSETAATLAWDSFKVIYLGDKAADPILDNQGNPLLDGALYWNTTSNQMKVYDLGGTVWVLTTDDADRLDGQHGAYYLARANHTGTQAVATLSDHDKAAHDTLGINAAELGGAAAALYARLLSPAFTGSPTAPTQAPGDNSTKLASTAYADAAALVAAKRFKSAGFTWVINTIKTYAHSLTGTPWKSWLGAKCLIAEHGYAAGDYVFDLTLYDTVPGYGSQAVSLDNTNAYYAGGEQAPLVNRKIAGPTADVVLMTVANWEFYLFAEFN